MKSTTTLLLISSIILISSCKKEEQPLEIPTVSIPELIIPEMTASEISFSDHELLYGNYRGCSYQGFTSEYSWNIDFRLGEGYKSGEKVFYPIEKKWHVSLSIDEHSDGGYTIENHEKWDEEVSWAPTGELYRYDPNKQLALKYADESDTNPEILMKFAMVPGDSWTLQSKGQTKFEVVEKFHFTLDGITYPALLMNLTTAYGDHKLRFLPTNSMYVFTPLNPNPLMLGIDYMNMLRPEWNNVFQIKNEKRPNKWPKNGFEKLSTSERDNEFLIHWKSDSSIIINEQYLSGKIQSF
ncbi:MAG: hypothetical protein MI810_10230 [Flavobacteriales bacterium]|nr:hypothetical protein [Flavobacteriales bacterium]